jgi:hypothetical protein
VRVARLPAALVAHLGPFLLPCILEPVEQVDVVSAASDRAESPARSAPPRTDATATGQKKHTHNTIVYSVIVLVLVLVFEVCPKPRLLTRDTWHINNIW